MRRLGIVAFVLLTARVYALDGPLADLINRVARPAEGADWKLTRDSAGKSSLLLPRGFNLRSAPEGETTTVLYAIAGGSPRDYRLLKVVADNLSVAEPSAESLAKFATSYLDNVLGKRLKEARITERGIVEVAGRKAFLIVGDGVTAGGLRSAVATVIVRVGETTYQLSGSCLEENLEKYSELFAQVFRSWRTG